MWRLAYDELKDGELLELMTAAPEIDDLRGFVDAMEDDGADIRFAAIYNEDGTMKILLRHKKDDE